MVIVDKARTAVVGVLGQARHGMGRAQAQLGGMQPGRQRGRLLQQLGEASYAEQTGTGTHEAVVQATAALDAHRKAHPQAGAPGRRETRRARDLMHRGAECIGEDDTVATAAQRMRDLGVGSLPICGGDDRLHGILTDRDIVVKCIAEGRDPAQVRTGDLAQGTLFWVEATADVGEVLHRMEDHHIKRLPVIENHRLVGMISEADLARHLDEHRLAEFVEKVYARS
jgi:CBS domain-containing protein